MSAPKRSKAIRSDQRKEFIVCLLNYDPFCDLPSSYVKTAARRLERGCYNSNVQKANEKHIPNYWDNPLFNEQYQSICYNTKVNVDPNSSVNQSSGEMATYLVELIYNCMLVDWILETDQIMDKIDDILDRVLPRLPRIKISDVGLMNSWEMNPHISKSYLEEIALRGNQKVEQKSTKIYQCPACRGRDATYREVQTRSGDEGSTTMLRCCICGHRWRIYG